MTINYNTLGQDVWDAIRTKLVEADLTATNSTNATTYKANITSAHPDKVNNKPHVVINPIDAPESQFRFGGTEGKKFINVIIDVYTSNPVHLEQLADQIRTELKKNDLGINLVELSDATAFINPEFRKYHHKTITASYVE